MLERNEEEYANYFNMIKQNVCRVEFMWKKRIDLLFFPKPPEAVALTDASKKELEDNVNMDTTESLQTDFVERAEDLVEEMKHLSDISKYQLFKLLDKYIGSLRYIAFALAVLVNVLLALSVASVGPDCENGLDCGNQGE